MDSEILNKVYTIYKSTNLINGKSYIGVDSNWPKRKAVHKYWAFTGNTQSHFYNALRKYGWNNFDWELVYQSKDYEHTFHVMENYFIKKYDSFNNGYNMTMGGDGWQVGMKVSLETIEKRRQTRFKKYGTWHPIPPMLGKHQSEESKLKSSLSQSGYKNHMYGKKRTIKSRLKQSLSSMGKHTYQYEIINIHGFTQIINNMRQFCKDNNLSRQCMEKVARGQSKMGHHKGYKVKKIKDRS